MLINRRNFLISGTAAALFPTSTLANSGLAFTPDLIFENLERSVWISSNRNGDRAVYVIAAPWCPYCRQLYLTQKEASHDVDFRFVFMGFRRFGDAVANAYFSDDPDQVGVFYADPGARNNALGSQSKNFIDHVNRVTGHLMAKAIGSIITGSGGSGSGATFSYPTVVYRNDKGQAQALLGAWNALEQIFSSTGTSANTGARASRYVDLVRSPPSRQRLGRDYFANSEGTFLYSAPLSDAPKVDAFRKGSGYLFEYQAAVNGVEWLGTLPFGGFDGLMWGKKDEFFTQ